MGDVPEPKDHETAVDAVRRLAQIVDGIERDGLDADPEDLAVDLRSILDDIDGYLATLPDTVDIIVRCLQEIVRNDATRYEHHEPRRWDGRTPDMAGGTRWLEPNEIARKVLEKLGAKVPYALDEALEKAKLTKVTQHDTSTK